MRQVIAIALLIFAGYAQISFADKMKIAIIDLVANKVTEADSKVITDILRSEIIDSDRFIVIERSQLDAVLSEQGLQMSSVINADDAVKIGQLMAVNKILIGEVSSIGNKIIITVRIVDVEKGISEFSVKGESSSMYDSASAVRQITNELINRIEVRGRPFLSVKGNFLIPIDQFGDIIGLGYGGNVGFSILAPIIDNLYAGLDLGFYFFSEKIDAIATTFVVPLSINASYKFIIIDNLSLIPKIYGGYSLISMRYANGTDVSGNLLFRDVIGFNPIAGVELALSYAIGRNIRVMLGGSFNLIFEQDGMPMTVSVIANIDYLF